VVPGGLQRVVLEHFRRQPAKWSQEASRRSFWSISGASPQSGPRKPPEGRFGAFQTPARKVVPGGLQRVVLEHFKHQPAKWSQEASRRSFWSISGASPQSRPRKPPEGRFGGFQAPARKALPYSTRFCEPKSIGAIKKTLNNNIDLWPPPPDPDGDAILPYFTRCVSPNL
jgi:hypothetical protein